MAGSLSPQEFWKTTGMKQGSNTLKNGAVSTLGYPIMLRSIMNSKFLFSAARLEVRNELLV